ncbi:MAG TPA: DUF4476 domain-containing protein, partial [Bacteroidia bacterium]|nr:DUF4476 domain-containing protein [Bacteroidia bacterium]
GKKKHTMDYDSEKKIDGFLNNTNQQAPTITNNPTSADPQPVTTTVPTPEPVSTPTVSAFQTALTNIAAQPTDEGKLTAALALIQNGTLNVSQIKQVLELFSSEQAKLTFAKKACAQLKDPKVYAEIISLFMSQPVKQDLQNFFQGKR